jgi:hypothetical protein
VTDLNATPRSRRSARAYAGSQRWGRFSVQLQSNSRGWLHRVIPRKRHQVRHLCNLACFIAKHALSKTGVHVKTWLQLGSNCCPNRYKTQYHDTEQNQTNRLDGFSFSALGNTWCCVRSRSQVAILVAKLVNNSSPKLGHLGAFSRWSEPEKQRRQRDLAF